MPSRFFLFFAELRGGCRFALRAACRFARGAAYRFALATRMRAAGRAVVCSAGSPCVGIRPGRPDSAGFRSNSSAQRRRAALKLMGHMPRVPASRRSPRCTNPAHPVVGTPTSVNDGPLWTLHERIRPPQAELVGRVSRRRHPPFAGTARGLGGLRLRLTRPTWLHPNRPHDQG